MNAISVVACAAALLLAMSPHPARAVCRVVEPLSSSDDPGVVFDGTTTVLFVVAPDQIVDYRCADEGTRPDPETRLCPGGVAAMEVRDTLIHAAVRPALFANGGTAGLIMPVPARADVHPAPAELFEAVAGLMELDVHETIEFVEDPDLGYQCTDPHYSSNTMDVLVALPGALYGCGDGYYTPGLEDRETERWRPDAAGPRRPDGAVGGSSSSVVEGSEDEDVVRFERISTTDAYEVTVLNASTMDALLAWLDEQGFAHSADDDAAFAHYVGEGAWFVAIEVQPPALDGAHLALEPLVVTWRGSQVPVMNRLQYDPRGGAVVTDAFVMAPDRMEVSDGGGEILYAAPATFLFDARLNRFGLSEGWLTRIETERRMEIELPDAALVPAATEEEVRPVIERSTRVRIAQACCPSQSIPRGTPRTFVVERTYREGEEPPDETLYYRAPPPDPADCPAEPVAPSRTDAGSPGGYDAGRSASGHDAGHPAGGYDSDDDWGCFCSADRRRRQVRVAALLGWLPLLLALGFLVARSRSRR
jgi:hypothetical protein